MALIDFVNQTLLGRMMAAEQARHQQELADSALQTKQMLEQQRVENESQQNTLRGLRLAMEQQRQEDAKVAATQGLAAGRMGPEGQMPAYENPKLQAMAEANQNAGLVDFTRKIAEDEWKRAKEETRAEEWGANFEQGQTEFDRMMAWRWAQLRAQKDRAAGEAEQRRLLQGYGIQTRVLEGKAARRQKAIYQNLAQSKNFMGTTDEEKLRLWDYAGQMAEFENTERQANLARGYRERGAEFPEDIDDLIMGQNRVYTEGGAPAPYFPPLPPKPDSMRGQHPEDPTGTVSSKSDRLKGL